MGARALAVLAETFIQHVEHEYLFPILIAHEVIAYYRHVDDIFIMYDQNKTDIEQTLHEINNTQPSLKFTMDKENTKDQLLRYHYTSKR
jgi:hypothetical protein